MKFSVCLPTGCEGLMNPIPYVEPEDFVRLGQACERLGYDSVWSAEAYGSDAVTPAAWIAARTTRIHVGTAIMQMTARVPAMTAIAPIARRMGSIFFRSRNLTLLLKWVVRRAPASA